ncbi:MAG: LysM peptidoglycan-binding domain-containing protein, partial [Planctomycetes bacterium]|nr:LysM peptidoglycan-binding domain-containing protein [Planctomycetota bacterium]
MKRPGTSESTSYFAFVVIIIFGLFLYTGFRLHTPEEEAAPAAPLLTTHVQPQGDNLILVPENSTAPRDIQAVASVTFPSGNPLSPTSQPGPVAPPVATMQAQAFTAARQASNQEYLPLPKTNAVVYIVRPNDTLTGIAQNLLGSSNRWREIARLNTDTLPDPNQLKPGMRIYLPKRQGYTNAPVQTEKLYQVKENDSLYSLAVRFYKSPYAIAIIQEANREVLAGKTELFPGMELRLPSPDNRQMQSARRTYLVQPGDVLSEIADRFYNDSTQWRRIVKANPTVITDEKHLRVGAVLIIP